MSDTNGSNFQELSDLVKHGQENGVVTARELKQYLVDKGEYSEETFEKLVIYLDGKNIDLAEEDDKDATESRDSNEVVDTDESSSVDSVRSYMKDMGKRSLLDRTGEIEIAMQIEQGSKDVLEAISKMPGVSEYVVGQVDLAWEEESDVNDIVTGFLDLIFEADCLAQDQANEPESINESDSDEESSEEDDSDSNLFLDSGPDQEVLKERIDQLRILNAKFKQIEEQDQGMYSSSYKDVMASTSDILKNFKLSNQTRKSF